MYQEYPDGSLCVLCSSADCTGTTETEKKPPRFLPGENPLKETKVQPGAAGVLTITGSTTVLPVAAQAAEFYMDTHPGVVCSGQCGGSGSGSSLPEKGLP
jgi:ABC-type phosphate transport system substrate-binding protein